MYIVGEIQEASTGGGGAEMSDITLHYDFMSGVMLKTCFRMIANICQKGLLFIVVNVTYSLQCNHGAHSSLA